MKHVIVMPAHNEAVYIGRTLQSLVTQTERPDRLVVVDDGSTELDRRNRARIYGRA